MLYLDTSLLVSLYCPDANSLAAVELLRKADAPLLITNLCEIEATNALGLRLFRKEITPAQAELSRKNFELDLHGGVYQYRTIPEAAYSRARTLSLEWTPRLGTRTADLLHLAAALVLRATAFYSFDAQQLRTAEAVGLATPALPAAKRSRK